jgi:hypothetical protein
VTLAIAIVVAAVLVVVAARRRISQVGDELKARLSPVVPGPSQALVQLPALVQLRRFVLNLVYLKDQKVWWCGGKRRLLK